MGCEFLSCASEFLPDTGKGLGNASQFLTERASGRFGFTDCANCALRVAYKADSQSLGITSQRLALLFVLLIEYLFVNPVFFKP
jgi:hypothetical protein